MIVLETVVQILQIILGLGIIFLVLSQEGKEEGNIVTGSSNKGGSMGSSREDRLAKITKYVGIAYIVLTIAASSVMLINR